MTSGGSSQRKLPNLSTRCRRTFSSRSVRKSPTSGAFSIGISTSSKAVARCLSTHSRPSSRRSCSSISSTPTSWRRSTLPSKTKSTPRNSYRITKSTELSFDQVVTSTHIKTINFRTTTNIRITTSSTRGRMGARAIIISWNLP